METCEKKNSKAMLSRSNASMQYAKQCQLVPQGRLGIWQSMINPAHSRQERQHLPVLKDEREIASLGEYWPKRM